MRRSTVQATRALYVHQHPMITRSRTLRASGNNIMNLTSLSTDYIPNATAVDSASASSTFAAIPAPLDVIPDDDSDDKFHGEVQAYLDYTSEILNAQAEEVRLLRREVASVREEKADLKMQHEADATARKKEYQCPVCYELAWNSYVMDHPMDDVPATNESESPPAANDTEVPTAIPRTRRGLISRRPMNVIPDNDDLETPSAISSNRRRKLSLSSDDDDQSSSQAEDIHEKPQKVTDFKVRVVERVVEREVIPAHVEEQLAERDERIQQLQHELEAEKTLQKTGKAVRTDSTNCSHNSQAVDSTEVERRKLRGDVIDKGRTIESLTTLNKQLQRSLADSRQNSDRLKEELEELKGIHSSAKAEASNATQKRDEEIARLKKEFEDHRKAVPQDFVAKDPEIEILTAKLSTAESEIKEKTLRAELDRKAFTRLQAESKGQISRFTQQIKDLEASIVTKDTHSQELETAIQVLETGKARLKEAVATAEKKFGDQHSAQTVDILNLKQKVHDLDASIDSKDSHSRNLESAIQALEAEKANLKATVEAAQKEFEERIADKDLHAHMLNDMIQSLEMEKRKLEQNAALEKPQIEADRAALKKLKESTEAGTAQLPELEQRVNELQNNLATKDSLIELLNTNIDKLKTEKSQLEATAVADKPQIEADRAVLGILRDEIKVGKTRARELEGKINDLEASISSKDSHTETLNSTIQGLETEKRQLEATAAADKPQVEADRVALGKLRDETKAGQTRARELKGKIKDLEAIISSKDSHAQALESAIQGLETEKRRLEATVAADKPQIDADRAALKKLREENNGAHTQALNSKIQTLEADKRKLEEIAAAERPQIEADRATLGNLHREIEASAAQIRGLEQRIKNLVSRPDESEIEKILADNAALKSSAAQDRERLLGYQTNHVTKARFDALETDYYQLQV
ncbi:ER to Golgi vesicle transport intracellular protein transport [Lentinula edodes]|uniref:ER to Golgi vesicle transport intracellular protein transport n=1 Tax=Lentinula edodes TaxID=5353 RepID=A0A1Q3E360_LENED|nr:ER to Golgi vesicle transport intracellular protein transport [Lentinula edodes]